VSQPQPPAVPPPYGPPPAYGPAAAYPAPFGYAPQPGYPASPVPVAQQPVPAQAYPLPAGYGGQAGMVSCRFCGSVPAVSTSFRGHQGMVVMMRFLRTEGPFCRDCGLGIFRHMTSRTLIEGWYGYASFIATPITVLANLIKRGKVARLPAPEPNPYGSSRRPMDPGPGLLARPITWIGLCIPVVVLGLLVAVIAMNRSHGVSSAPLDGRPV
jgi:hypothetical protein